MNILKEYNIPWKGLSNGSHHFDFEIDDRFFGAFDDSEITGGELAVAVDMDKSATMLLLDIAIDGEVTVVCDRCLGSVAIPVEYDGELKVKFSEEIQDYDGEIMWISSANGEISLADYIYESIVLNLPYQKVHGEDAEGNLMCDKEMLARFKIVSQDEFDALDVESHTVIGDSTEGLKLQQLKSQLEEKE